MLSVYEKLGTGKGYNRKLRATGKISGIIYGSNMKPMMLEFNPSEFLKVLKSSPKKYNSIIELELNTKDGKKTKEMVILKDWQRHPVTEEYLHVDFYKFNPEEKQVFKVPFAVKGRAKGVVAGGKLSISLKKIKIQARPSDVPVEIVHDITNLGRGEVVRIKDINYPEGVSPLYEARQALVSVSALKLGPGGSAAGEEEEVVVE